MQKLSHFSSKLRSNNKQLKTKKVSFSDSIGIRISMSGDNGDRLKLHSDNSLNKVSPIHSKHQIIENDDNDLKSRQIYFVPDYLQHSLVLNNGDWNRKRSVTTIRKENCKKRHMLHISGRMQAGGTCEEFQAQPIPISVNLPCEKKRPKTPPVVVCEKCGGYSYDGQTCCDTNDDKKNLTPIKMSNSPFPCCPCCTSIAEKKKIKANAYEERLLQNNPLMGKFADKILPFFLPGNKGRLPAIIGYGKEGNPIYGPPGAADNIIGYNAFGEPILVPGSGGPNDKGLVMGYTKQGKPIYPPTNVTPKDAMAILGVYVKDGSPIIGNSKLMGGMMIRGNGKDGLPKYIPAPANKLLGKKKQKNDSQEEGEKPPIKKGLTKSAKLLRDIQNFYHYSQHPKCLEIVERVPQKMSWLYTKQPKSATNLAFWIPPKFKPGSVPLRIAMKIRKDRNGRPMKSPYASMNFRRCYCKPCHCECTDCSQKKLERYFKKKYDLPASAFRRK